MSILPKNRVIAAPLAGVSDSVYRRRARRYGAGLVFTEMISAEGLRRNSRKTLGMLRFDSDERPIGIQLFDNSPEAISDAASMAKDFGFDFVDINLGCPERKVVVKGAGAALLKSPRLAVEVVKAAVEATELPVSVKMRSGWLDGDETYLELIPEFAAMGVGFVTLHPRSRAQRFSGHADWSKIKRAVDISAIPVVGSGDIRSGDDAARMIVDTGCACVMVGRASFGNPWIFGSVSAALSGDPRPKPPDYRQIVSACIEYVRDLVEFHGERTGVNLSKKHVVWFTTGLPGCKTVRTEVFRATTAIQVFGALGTYLEMFDDTCFFGEDPERFQTLKFAALSRA